MTAPATQPAPRPARSGNASAIRAARLCDAPTRAVQGPSRAEAPDQPAGHGSGASRPGPANRRGRATRRVAPRSLESRYARRAVRPRQPSTAANAPKLQPGADLPVTAPRPPGDLARTSNRVVAPRSLESRYARCAVRPRQPSTARNAPKLLQPGADLPVTASRPPGDLARTSKRVGRATLPWNRATLAARCAHGSRARPATRRSCSNPELTLPVAASGRHPPLRANPALLDRIVGGAQACGVDPRDRDAAPYSAELEPVAGSAGAAPTPRARPASALSSDDLPTLAAPTRATVMPGMTAPPPRPTNPARLRSVRTTETVSQAPSEITRTGVAMSR